MDKLIESVNMSGPKAKTDPLPSNWLTFLLNQHARSTNPDFDLYGLPEESARPMAEAYTKIFAIYLELHNS